MTKKVGLTMSPKTLEIEVWVDASYATGKKRKSKSGCVMTMGGSPFVWKSKTQRITAKSSMEAELIALSDIVGWVLWSMEWLEAQGYTNIQSTIWEDNKACLELIEQGKPASDASAHIQTRYFFISEKIKSHKIRVKYLHTKRMNADLFTKGTSIPIFKFIK